LLNETSGAIASKSSKLLSSFNISVKFNYSNNIVKITHCLISKHLVLTRLDVIQKRNFIMEPGVCDVLSVLLSHKEGQNTSITVTYVGDTNLRSGNNTQWFPFSSHTQLVMVALFIVLLVIGNTRILYSDQAIFDLLLKFAHIQRLREL
jgi:hypothetical protein